jgi:2-dehydro-3-deoxyglucarate aldolase/4-hydroxy-2-oxoheptanedioate aldolase
MGAQGVMVPNVRTPEQARQSINALRYRPEGKRGLGLGMAQNDYLPPNAAQYLREANENHTFVCQIESVTALKNLDEIASMPGVDILWVGHFDLTSSMGIVAQFDHPDFLAALRKVAEAAKRYGKGAGIQPNSVEQAKLWIAQGYNVISYGVDHGVYRRALQEGADAMRLLP